MTSRSYWLFLTPPSPIVTLFSTKALVLLSQNPWYPLPPKVETSFMDGPKQHFIERSTQASTSGPFARLSGCSTRAWTSLNYCRKHRNRSRSVNTAWPAHPLAVFQWITASNKSQIYDEKIYCFHRLTESPTKNDNNN